MGGGGGGAKESRCPIQIQHTHLWKLIPEVYCIYVALQISWVW